ncbi:hypothetical protein DB347_02920 [Opitutaceae bacterium EW11]|nr:hypothetical protein DB347_02920 [Opitutaceae bacterium EW11]
MQLTKHWAAVLDDYVIDLAWSPDGTRLAAASAAGPVTLFAAADGAKQHVLPGHEDGANCLAWSPSGLLATGGQDGAVKFWDAAAGQHTATAQLGGGWVEHLAWKPRKAGLGGQTSEFGNQRTEAGSQAAEPGLSVDSGLTSATRSLSSDLLAASAGRQLVFLNSDGTTRHTFKPAPKTISAVAWQPAGGCVAVAYFGGVVLWDADDFVAQKEFPYGNGIHALVWSPDNKWLVSGNQDPSVHLWIPETGVELHMSGYEGKVKELSFDTSSRWLATGGGKDACIWDCSGEGPEGREPQMFPHDAKVCAVAFQHSHGLLATASQDGAVMLWSPERRQPLRATIRMPNPATKLVWSPDDALLAIGSEQGAVYVLRCEA